MHDGRTTFLACMRAMCAPGAPIELACVPRISGHTELDSAAAVLLALLDRGLTLGVTGGHTARQVAAAVMVDTGARHGDVADADWVLVHGAAADAIARSRRGSSLVPEQGATLVIATEAEPQPVSLTGPGVNGQATAWIPLDDVAVHAFTAANAAAPCGVDLLLVAGSCVIGLPRSVTLGAP
ncbi:phosphonate C-P lyase system protein PhnH [Mycolicibacterium pulveris]|uniref:phosphonate C-P lyase system protein PhnH n=1 Tax=Mycolicibacterium pulveris TaxID=36813 RepID=UPI003CEE30B8